MPLPDLCRAVGARPEGVWVVWHDVEPHGYWIKGIRIVTPGGYDSWQSAGDVGAALVVLRRTLGLNEHELVTGSGETVELDAACIEVDAIAAPADHIQQRCELARIDVGM